MLSFTRHVLASAAALTSTPTASSGLQCSYSDQFALYLVWTPAASGRTLTVTIEVSADKDDTTDASATWHRLGSFDYSDADTKADIQEDIQEVSTGTDAVALVPYVFSCPARRIRIKYDQSGASGGTLTATLLYRAS